MTSTYTCCQCCLNFTDDYEVYRTFFDDLGSSIGNPDWRLCRGCVKDNHHFTQRLFCGLGLGCLIGGCIWYSCMWYGLI